MQPKREHDAYKQLVNIQNGLATLGPEAVQLRATLDALFAQWGIDCGAQPTQYPALIRVRDLERFDYFRNFPQLLLCASCIQQEYLKGEYVEGGSISYIPPEHLAGSDYAYPSAACYQVYLHLQDQQLIRPHYVTTVAQCFRNEAEYVGLKRLWSFNMREIVCVGDQASVLAHLSRFRARIQAFSELLGLPLTIDVATDPFFDRRASRAVMQRLFPVKEEFLFDQEVAIASVNFHRNFFGERCNIRLEDGSPAFSGCVAFGLERWLHALLTHFKGDVVGILERLAERGRHEAA